MTLNYQVFATGGEEWINQSKIGIAAEMHVISTAMTISPWVIKSSPPVASAHLFLQPVSGRDYRTIFNMWF